MRIEESIQYIPMIPQLRVYCAGVWNNVVMAAVCVTGLWVLPLILSAGFCSSASSPLLAGGVVVTHVASTSPLFGSLAAGDVLLALNDKYVPSPTDFGRIITDLHTSIHGSTLDSATAGAIENRYMPYWTTVTTGTSKEHRASPQHVRRDVVQAPSGVCVSSIDLERLMVPELQCCRDVLLAPGSYHSKTDESQLHERDEMNSCFLHSSDKPTKKSVLSTPIASVDVVESSFAPFATHNAESSVTTLTAALYCLPARGVMADGSIDPLTSVAGGAGRCISDGDCQYESMQLDGEGVGAGLGGRSSRCLRPLTAFPTSIISITVLPRQHTAVPLSFLRVDNGVVAPNENISSWGRRSSNIDEQSKHSHSHTVLFEGTADELLSALSVGEYLLKPWLARAAGGVHSWLFDWLMSLPDTCALYLWLCVQVLHSQCFALIFDCFYLQLNLSVAFVNMLPVYTLDGGLACPQFCRMLFSRW